jgi:hypothetical protein
MFIARQQAFTIRQQVIAIYCWGFAIRWFIFDVK